MYAVARRKDFPPPSEVVGVVRFYNAEDVEFLGQDGQSFRAPGVRRPSASVTSDLQKLPGKAAKKAAGQVCGASDSHDYQRVDFVETNERP